MGIESRSIPAGAISFFQWSQCKQHSSKGDVLYLYWAGLIFPIYLNRKFKKSSYQKPLEQLQYNVAEMFLWWSCTKIVQAIWIRQKTWPPGGGAYFALYIYIEKLEKSSCQKPLDRFHYNLAKMFPWWPSTKIVQVIVICQKTWPLGGGAYFPYISI